MSERRPYRHYTPERLSAELDAARRTLMSLQSEQQQRTAEKSVAEWPQGYGHRPAEKVTAPSSTVSEWLDHTPAASLRSACGSGSPRPIEPMITTKQPRPCLDTPTTPARVHVEREAVKPLTDGFYRRLSADGARIFKVVWNQTGANLYAKELVTELIPATDDEPMHYVATWTYAPGALRQLTAAMRLTEEQAAEFGQLYGVCCICSARLSNEESIERGIGPVCADKQGW